MGDKSSGQIQVQVEALQKRRNEQIVLLQKQRDLRIQQILESIKIIQINTQLTIEKANTEANQRIEQLKAEVVSVPPKTTKGGNKRRVLKEYSTKQEDSMNFDQTPSDHIRTTPASAPMKRRASPKRRRGGLSRGQSESDSSKMTSEEQGK